LVCNLLSSLPGGNTTPQQVRIYKETRCDGQDAKALCWESTRKLSEVVNVHPEMRQFS
jgi:hypothetical protein